MLSEGLDEYVFRGFPTSISEEIKRIERERAQEKISDETMMRQIAMLVALAQQRLERFEKDKFYYGMQESADAESDAANSAREKYSVTPNHQSVALITKAIDERIKAINSPLPKRGSKEELADELRELLQRRQDINREIRIVRNRLRTLSGQM